MKVAGTPADVATRARHLGDVGIDEAVGTGKITAADAKAGHICAREIVGTLKVLTADPGTGQISAGEIAGAAGSLKMTATQIEP